MLNGTSPSLTSECRSYEEKIRSYGGVELFLGGIGEDGHIAFNEPGSSLASRTRVKTLARGTIDANVSFRGDGDLVFLRGERDLGFELIGLGGKRLVCVVEVL
jgi:6-phosphogluconolactonase/glucosamine-6-phosphate isomerase/deaminase